MLEEPTLLREQVGPYSIGDIRGSFSERSVISKDLRDRIHYGDQLEERQCDLFLRYTLTLDVGSGMVFGRGSSEPEAQAGDA